ncbi:MAG: GspE/PulE family protein, partial [Pseudohongiellaceae bacterium]
MNPGLTQKNPVAEEAIELPPIPTRLNTGAETLLNAPVSLLQENAPVQRGKLISLSPAAEKITILDDAQQRVTVPMGKVLAVYFEDKMLLRPDHGVEPVVGSLELQPLPVQPYSVKLRNGRTESGKMFTAFQSGLGLHVFKAHGPDHLSRLFFPHQAISKVRLGNKLGEALIESGKLSEESLALALQEQRRLLAGGRERPVETEKSGSINRQPRIGEVLVGMGMSSSADVQREIARQIGIPFVNLKAQEHQKEALELIPRELAEKYGAIPIRLIGNTLLVAMENPLNTEVIDMVEFIANHHIELVSATHDDIHAAINAHYSGAGIGKEILDAENLQQILHLDDNQQAELTDAERLSTGRPVVRLVTKIIIDAIKKNASDIHIRPREGVTDLLYRIDGVLVLVRSFSNALLAAVVGRIKIIGRMDIAERRLPQDGRAKVMESGNAVDLRISIIPTVNGESVVIRLLNTMSGLKSISELGLSTKDSDLFIDLLNKNNGVILVTGPTGSG